ncbi:MAG: alpha/beta fold hydrolase, partial [Promethearchaeota archaeon]
MSFLDFFKSNKKITGLIISGILIISGVIPLIIFIFFADMNHLYTIKQVTLTTEDNVEINSLIYTPNNMTGKHPGIVIGHGFTGNALHMQLLAIEFVKREFIVVNINFRGHGNSGGYLPAFSDPNMINIIEQDMIAGIEYLKALGNVDRIGLLGHSMGSMTALKTSEDLSNQVNATVILGMSSGFEQDLHSILAGDNGMSSEHNFSKISNLLIANGIFEQMFTKEISLNLLREYTNISDVGTETLYGNFTHGNACKVVMGATEHLFEPHDYHIIYESVAWFEMAFYGNIRWDITVTSVFYEISFFIAVIGILMLGFVLIIYINRFLWRDKSQNLQKNVIKDTSTLKLTIFYLMAMIIGVVVMGVGIFTFGEILPVSLGELLYGILAGTSIGSMIMY